MHKVSAQTAAIIRILTHLAAAGALVLVIASEGLISPNVAATCLGWVRDALHTVRLAAMDSQTQWAIVASLWIYFLGFLVLEYRLGRCHPWWHWANPFLWVFGLVGLGTGRYLCDWRFGRDQLPFVTMFAGVVFGLLVRNWVLWPDDAQVRAKRARFVLGVMIIVLGMLALIQPPWGVTYQYRGELRWKGIWEGPNTYGMMMSTGVVLAIGMLMWSCAGHRTTQRAPHQPTTQSAQPSPTERVKTIAGRLWPWVCALSGAACGLGLLKSYSRGAWLSTAVGLAYLVWCWLRWPGLGLRRPRRWLHLNAAWLILLAISLVIIGYWVFRDTELRPVRRMYSVGNPDDFSWRNRAMTWPGALQMMADRPLLGFGWGQPGSVYDSWYAPLSATETGAFRLNDHFMLGASAGPIALLCLWLAITCGLAGQAPRLDTRTEPRQVRGLPPWTVPAHATALALIVACFFNNGLFKLGPGCAFWPLFFLGIASGGRFRSTPGQVRGMVGLCFIFGVALALARHTDPFVRREFVLRTAAGEPVNCLAVIPKHVPRRMPTVVFMHGSSGNLLTSGEVLRRFAELGVAAVNFDYDKKDQARFERQLAAVMEFLRDGRRQTWARTDAIGWVVHSLGGMRAYPYVVRNPDRAPATLVAIATGTALEPADTTTSTPLNTSVWMIHGENDETFRLSEVQKLADALGKMGAKATLTVIPQAGHLFDNDQPVLWRAAGEFCAAALGGLNPTHNHIPAAAGIPWIPIFALGCVVLSWILAIRRRKKLSTGLNRSPGRGRVLPILAHGAAVTALSVSLLQFIVLSLPARGPAMTLATVWAVPKTLRPELEWLKAKGQLDGSVGAVVDSLRLTVRQRAWFFNQLDTDLYREHLLAVRLTDTEPEDPRWRRALWEVLYQPVRRERLVESVVPTAVRKLRERVSVVASAEPQPTSGVLDTWRTGVTTPAGFAKLCVAGLRALGIPARLAADSGKAEYWTGSRWAEVPKPIVLTIPAMTDAQQP